MELLHFQYADIAVRQYAVTCLEKLRYSNNVHVQCIPSQGLIQNDVLDFILSRG